MRPLTSPFTLPQSLFFFFNDTATTEIYTLSLHDALPIFAAAAAGGTVRVNPRGREVGVAREIVLTKADLASARVKDRKSTRLNSSHSQISYAVFCLKKKKNISDHENNGLSARYELPST